MIHQIRWAVALTWLLALFEAAPCWGGGFWLYETGPDIATASAGRAAAAQDASVALDNPAGMTHLKRSQAVGNLSLLVPNVRFHKEQETDVDGNSGGNAGSVTAAPSISLAHHLSERWWLGVSLGSYLGSGLEYDGGWAGRYYVQKAKLTTAGLNPSLAFKVTEKLSLGAGFTVLYGSLEQRTALNNVLDGLPDGRIKVADEDVGFGGNCGALFEFDEGTRVGVGYRSRIKLNFKDRPSIHNLGPTLGAVLPQAQGKVNLEITLPQALLVSAYHQLTGRLALLANFGWQDWSEFGKTTVKIGDGEAETENRHFNDTFQGAIGAQYRVAARWLASVGFAYDSSPVTDRRRTPDFPVDRQLRFGTGIRYDWSDDVTIGLGYEFVDLGDADFDVNRNELTGRVQGDFRTNHVNVVAASFIWRFGPASTCGSTC